MSFKLDDSYIDVAERVREFYEKNPNGAIRRVDSRFVCDPDGQVLGYFYRAAVYRDIADPLPAGEGEAYEQIPGKTPYTKDSEVMNAETSAWGRAIVAAGIPSKKIASAEEVRNRQGSAGAATDVVASSPGASPSPTPAPAGTPLPFGKYKGRSLEDLVAAGGKEKGYVEWLASGAYEPKTDAQQQIKNAAYALTNEDVEAAFAGAFPNEIDDIPFERTI
jgi:hypothetical protein